MLKVLQEFTNLYGGIKYYINYFANVNTSIKYQFGEILHVDLCLVGSSAIYFVFFNSQIYFKKKKTGGISFNSTAQLTHVDEKLCYQILHEYKIHNAEVFSRIIDNNHSRDNVRIIYVEK